jgi:ATP-binding cassette subfamily F protein 3
MRIAAGLLDVDSGTRELGHNVKLAFYAQHQIEALDPRRSVLEELGADCPLDLIPRLRTLLGSFLFVGDDVEKKVSVLSGGEGARLALAKLLLQGANFLVLDEPTNHLDMYARDVLTEALGEFGGTLLFISHDRSLINALATHVIEIVPGPGCARVTRYAGGFDEYERRTQGEASAAAAPPARPARSDPHAAPAAPPRPKRGGGRNAVRKLRTESSATEQAIEQAEADIERVDWQFADPAIARDGARMQQLAQERAQLVAKRDALYATWEQLEQQIADLDPSAPD